jgi:hypothetical protein
MLGTPLSKKMFPAALILEGRQCLLVGGGRVAMRKAAKLVEAGAALGGRRNVMEQLAPAGPVYQAGTLSGNPLAVAAGLVTLEKIERDNPFPRIGKKLFRSFQGVEVQQSGSAFTFFSGKELALLVASFAELLARGA